MDEKPDKHTIELCLGSSCSARGNGQNLQLVQKYLQEKELENEVELSGALCKDCCNEGPIISINNKMYKRVDTNSLLDILDFHFEKGE